ncbi:MAG TPA: hypothetical protein VGF94_27365 [Kofleriaceae bacterium]
MVRQVATLLVIAACAGGHTTGPTPPAESWPDAVSGKTVSATGKLERTNEFAAPPPGPGGEHTAETAGDVYVLRDCKYTSP